LANPPIATYVDGIYVGRPDAMSGMLYDIDRVEVLRGPQGTLYGRNSTGGNVNIISAPPVPRFDATADASYGSYNDVLAHGMVNLPVTDTLALRGAVAYHANDGYVNTEGSTSRNYGASDEMAGRLSALWKPTEQFKWDLIVEDYINNGTPSIDILTGPDGKPADGQPVYDRTVSNAVEPELKARNFSARSRMDWKINDDTTVSYLAGYQDSTNQPQTVFGEDTLYQNKPVQAINQEVDVSTDLGPLQNIFGANAYYQHIDDDANSGLPPLDWYLEVATKIKTTSFGFFDQATFKLTDSLRLIGGLRYSQEKFDVTDSSATICVGLNNPAVASHSLPYLLSHNSQLLAADSSCFVAPSFSGGGGTSPTSGTIGSHKLTWKAGLAYDFSPKTSGYATVSTGFKSAGLNLGSGLTPATAKYAPEDVTNYEIGLKTRAFDGKLSLNADIYDMEYTNIQVTTLTYINHVLASYTENAASAKNYGAELEYNWHIDARTLFGGYFNYIHATYTNFTSALDSLTNIDYDAKGYTLPYSPHYSIEGHLEHDFELGNGGTLTPKATVYWQSLSYIRDVNQPIDLIPSWHKTDLNLIYTDPSRAWTLTGYVYNLENKAIRNGGFVYAGEYISSYNRPRSFGVRFAYVY